VFPAILTFVLIAIYVIPLLGAFNDPRSKLFTIVTVAFGVLVLFLALLLLWSMLWKYSVVAIIANAAILTAVPAGTSIWHRRVAVVLAFVAILYLVDPFNGHSFLSFHWTGTNGVSQQAGLQDAAKSNWAWGNLETGPTSNYRDISPTSCARYYQWFYLNNADWEEIKYENQYHEHSVGDHKRYWGICNVGWVHAINIIAGLFVIFQILVTCLGLFLLTKSSQDDVHQVNFDRPKSSQKVAPTDTVPITDPHP
jgi:hypothetical protein